MLIAINIAVFLYQIRLPDPGNVRSCADTMAATAQGFVCNYGSIPVEIMRGQDVFTLLTSMFLHGGWAHIFGNMLFLWVFGDNVEDAFGHLGYLVFYLATGIAASAAHIFLNQGSSIPSVGASGAISGILGAYIIFFGSNPIRVLIAYFITVVPAWVMIGLWAAQQFIATYGSIAMTEQTSGGGVAYAAHAGGFLAGLILGVLLRGTLGQPEQRPKSNSGRFA
jgi:membrane associated rhomboid family serine protease